MPDRDRVRIGLIGLGDIGLGQHLPALLRRRDVEVAAIADHSEARLVEAAALAGSSVAATADPAELLDGDLEAVVIATPPWVTPEIAFAALDRGLHVLAEKPIAVQQRDLERFRRMPDDQAGRFQLGLTYRHHPAIGRLRDLMARGQFGSGPMLIRAAIYDEPLRPDDEAHVARISGALAHGRPHVHEGAHVFDWIAYIMGTRDVDVTSAWAIATSPSFPMENLVGATARFPDGSVVVYEFGWFAKRLPAGGIDFVGTEMLATLTGDLRLVLHHPDGTSETLFGDLADRMQVSFDLQLESFVRLVRGELPAPSVGVADGLAAHETAMAIDDLLEAARR